MGQLKTGCFSVPVNFPVLRACRIRAGYPTVISFDTKLKKSGFTFSYRSLESKRPHDKNDRIRRVSNEKAEVIAAIFGMPVDAVFPGYSTAKADYEAEVLKTRYKPFTTIEERNKYIEDNLWRAQRAARRYSKILRDYYGRCVVWEDAEVCAMAYEILVEEANKAMTFGILKGYSFDLWLELSIKSGFGEFKIEWSKQRETYASFSSYSLDAPKYGESSGGKTDKTYADVDERLADLDSNPENYVLALETVQERLRKQQSKSKNRSAKPAGSSCVCYV